MFTMNWNDLQYRKPKPIKKKVKQRKWSQVVSVKYPLGKTDFSASSWEEYQEWIKKQKKLQEKAQNRSKKKKGKTTKAKAEKLVKTPGNSVKRKPMTYEEQLKDERWQKKRKEVLDAKGYACAICGKRSDLQIHHLEYKSGKMAWEYPMSNFVVLCSKHHKEIHNIK